MRIKPKQYAVSLYEATKNLAPAEIRPALINFVKILVKNNSLKDAAQIINHFLKYSNQKEGVIDLKIKTAHQIKDELVREICQIVPNFLDRKAAKINVKKEIDETLLGGFVLECEDMVFDGSLKNRIKILKNNLLNK